ncbi:MAG TPA: alpha/beta hydrolase [Solimonas sp.]|nr:alpha/beta hydrolase [Solimonas sp.]
MASSFMRGLMRFATRLTIKPILSPNVPVRLQRRLLKLAGAATRVPRGVAVKPDTLGGLPGEWLGDSPVAGSPVILFLHGGGYCVGSLDSHRPITASLAKAAQLPVYAADYRLAPEHPYPAALNDAVAVYRALLDAGFDRIVLAGDSAGGGLALATALSLRDAGLPLPAALLLLSPWADLACSGATMRTHAAHDPMLSAAVLQRWGNEYRGRVPADHPLCSPLMAELRGLPPVLIQVGSDEVLLDDSMRLEKKLQQARVPVTLQVCPGLWHDFQLNAGVLSESDDAIAALAAFARDTLASPAPQKSRRSA